MSIWPSSRLVSLVTLTVKAKASTQPRETEITLLGHIQAGPCSPFPGTGTPLLPAVLHPTGTQIPLKQQRFLVLFSQHSTCLALCGVQSQCLTLEICSGVGVWLSSIPGWKMALCIKVTLSALIMGQKCSR